MRNASMLHHACCASTCSATFPHCSSVNRRGDENYEDDGDCTPYTRNKRSRCPHHRALARRVAVLGTSSPFDNGVGPTQAVTKRTHDSVGREVDELEAMALAVVTTVDLTLSA